MEKKIIIKRRYDASRNTATEVGGITMTQQQFREECDINNIMKRFEATGLLPEMIKSNPQYGDFSSLPDYQTSLGIVIKAEEQFMALPAAVRARFSNDPGKFLEFATNPNNIDQMIEMGLATKRDNTQQNPPTQQNQNPNQNQNQTQNQSQNPPQNTKRKSQSSDPQLSTSES